jgi:putative ABC transport system ATP-binding protein/lipoprotein-releasing system ATP-binding protein
MLTADVQLESIRFGYRSGSGELFDGLDYRFATGTVTAISGSSGRGKSTLLFLIGLLLQPTAGAVLFGGKRVDNGSDATRADLRASWLGFVFQDASLDASRSILDNVVEPALYSGARRRETESRARRLLDQFQVDVPARRKPSAISGGQGQRVALCRALVHAPPIVLADEPTGNLDPESGAVVLSALRNRADAGATVIIASHDPNVHALSDTVLAL